MPTYEYECKECGAVVEVFHSMAEPARKRLRKTDPKPCNCDAGVQRRIGTGAGLIFKGSGFYETDYRSDAYKSAANAEKEAGSKKPDQPESSGKADKAEKSTTSGTSEPGATSKKSAKPERKKGSSS